MTTVQKSAVVAVVAALTGAGVYHFVPKPAKESGGGANADVAALIQERDNLRSQVAALKTDAQNSQAELNRLRDEVGRSRRSGGRERESAAPPPAVATSPSDFDEQHWELRASGSIKELTQKLGLTPEQAQTLKGFLRAYALTEHTLTQKLSTSPPDAPVLSEFFAAKQQSEREIESILSPQQISAYRALQEEKFAAAARVSANGELIEMQNVVGLSQGQQDSVFPALYKEVLKEQRRTEGGLYDSADGPLPESVMASMQQSVDRRIEALRPVLTNEQLEKYRQIMALRRARVLMRANVGGR